MFVPRRRARLAAPGSGVRNTIRRSARSWIEKVRSSVALQGSATIYTLSRAVVSSNHVQAKREKKVAAQNAQIAREI